METLIKYLLQRWRFSLFIIFGAYLPGFLYLFLNKYQLFLELDFLKLSILSLILGLPGLVISLIGFFMVLTLISSQIKSTNANFWIVTDSLLANWFSMLNMVSLEDTTKRDIIIYIVCLFICMFAGGIVYYVNNKNRCNDKKG